MCTDCHSPPVLLETLDPQSILSDHDSDEADVEEVQESSVQDYSIVADNQNGSGNSTVSVSDTPPSLHNSSGSSAK